MTAPKQPPDLSPDELTVVECLANGMTRAEIVVYMRTSDHKVKTDTQSLYAKLGASNAAQAVGAAYEAALLPRSVNDLIVLFAAIRERLTTTTATAHSRKDTR